MTHDTANFMGMGRCQEKGFTLLDVLLAIVIFAIGMLALASLQGNLTRSSSDANMRTVAANIAEEMIEDRRTFEQFASEPGRKAFDDIVDQTLSVRRGDVDGVGGNDYTVQIDVHDYYFQADRATVSETPPTGATAPDFKYLELTVSWNTGDDALGFQVDQSQAPDLLGTGSLTVSTVVPRVASLNNAKVAAEDDEAQGRPAAPYTPGANPDIVALKLHDGGEGEASKFKESTSPQPDVIRSDNVETWFDVVTYSQAPTGDAVFLRREEFLVVSCECEFAEGTGPARLPTLWNGYDYTDGAFEEKVYGVVPNGVQQSQYCGVCCRDHHDGQGSGSDVVYNDLTATGSGDHPHYARDNQGNIISQPVTSGTYVEACRLIRSDGYLRVTKDAVQQGLYGFPEDYLTFDQGVLDYSDYVIEAVSDHYETNSYPQPEDLSPPYEIPASDETIPTSLPTVYLTDTQQLRSRGVYTDYLSADALANLNNCFSNWPNNPMPTPDNVDCKVPNVSSPLEIYPFFDIQLTWLSRWPETSPYFDVTNEPIATNNDHDRGFAELVGDAGGTDKVDITSHKGNLGLSGTGPIDNTYDQNIAVKPLWIMANLGATLPPGGVVVSGGLAVDAAVKNLDAADLVLQADQALCGQTDVGFTCLVSGTAGTLTVSGYTRNNKTRWACSEVLGELSSTAFVDGGTETTTFALPGATTANANIWISSEEGCP